MTHYLVAVFIEEDKLDDYQTEVARLLEPYREARIDNLGGSAPRAKWDYWQFASEGQHLIDAADYVHGIVEGEYAPFGIVAPEIGWWDRYDEMGGMPEEFDQEWWQAINSESVKQAWTIKYLEMASALRSRGYVPIVVDAHR